MTALTHLSGTMVVFVNAKVHFPGPMLGLLFPAAKIEGLVPSEILKLTWLIWREEM